MSLTGRGSAANVADEAPKAGTNFVLLFHALLRGVAMVRQSHAISDQQQRLEALGDLALDQR